MKYPSPTGQAKAAQPTTAGSGAVSGAAGAPASPSAPGSPTANRLRELEQLRKDGLITQQEYEEKRKGVLSTL